MIDPKLMICMVVDNGRKNTFGGSGFSDNLTNNTNG